MKNVEIWVMKKTDGSWKFRVDFWLFGPKTVLLGFIEKQAPQKALCLGPDPPPGEKWIFIEIYRFLPKIGPSIEPEKPSPKSASTANPPQKRWFYSKFIENVIILSLYHFLKYYLMPIGLISILYLYHL
jgi:hypothetical protein